MSLKSLDDDDDIDDLAPTLAAPARLHDGRTFTRVTVTVKFGFMSPLRHRYVNSHPGRFDAGTSAGASL